ncbi:MAG: helix-turn-helix domain-containing protein [Bacteroidales bacterium]|nr:helix-turn-helix domain-containing protein [Bacteroidales bacterium]
MKKALIKIPDKGDPSDILQLFPRYNLQLLCCRYWWLKNWENQELSFPYWRIYRNTQAGASIIYDGKIYPLTPDKVIVIAPNTSYASRLFDQRIPEKGYNLKGGRLSGNRTEQQMIEKGAVLHLFIHFNLGMPYDNVSPGIYVFDVSEDLIQKFNTITSHLKFEYAQFNFHTLLAIQSLIGDLLSKIPVSNWDLMSNDYRIINVLSYIENNVSTDLSNHVLAEKARMATNSFTRLFTEELGISPQRYVKKKRIDKACVFLHHFDYSIEIVATKTGFADRYHFSKIFKQNTGFSPARYRKEFGLK